MKWAPQGLEKVSEWKRRVGAVPLVAIGGLTIERAPGVLAAGADTLSVVTDITLNADPEARTRAWLAATAQARTEYKKNQSVLGCRRALAFSVRSGVIVQADAPLRLVIVPRPSALHLAA